MSWLFGSIFFLGILTGIAIGAALIGWQSIDNHYVDKDDLAKLADTLRRANDD